MPYATLALALLVVLPVAWPVPHLGDLFLLWGVGRMTLDGMSPYDRATWQAMTARYPSEVVDGAVNVIPNMAQLPGVVWPYPPWTAYVFAPFAALPPAVGTTTLHLAYIAAGIAAAIVLARLLPGRASTLYALALAAFGLFQPFAMDVRSGQFATFLLLGVALVTYGIVRDREAFVVAGALVLFLKPHLFSIFALVVLVILVRRGRWRPIAVTAGILVLVAVATIARQPESLAAMFAGGTDRAGVPDRFATTWAVARALVPQGDITGIGWLLAGAVVAVVAAASSRSPARLRMPVLLSAALVGSLAVSPYVQAYDELVLLPAVFVAIAAVEMPTRASWRALQLTLAIVIGVLYPWVAVVLQIATGTQASSGAIPLLFAVLLASSVVAASRPLARLE